MAQKVLKSAAERVPANADMLRQVATHAGHSLPSALVCRALEAAGVPMDPLDLKDRTPGRTAA